MELKFNFINFLVLFAAFETIEMRQSSSSPHRGKSSSSHKLNRSSHNSSFPGPATPTPYGFNISAGPKITYPISPLLPSFRYPSTVRPRIFGYPKSSRGGHKDPRYPPNRDHNSPNGRVPSRRKSFFPKVNKGNSGSPGFISSPVVMYYLLPCTLLFHVTL